MVFVGIASAILGFLVAAILFLFQQPTNPQIPLDARAQTADCVQLAGSELQTCCQNWANEQDILTVACVGRWQMVAGQCSWQCQTK